MKWMRRSMNQHQSLYQGVGTVRLAKPVHHHHPQQAYHCQGRYSLRRDDGRTRGKQTGRNEDDPATKGGSERRERAAGRRDAATFFDGGRITPGQFARGALILSFSVISSDNASTARTEGSNRELLKMAPMACRGVRS